MRNRKIVVSDGKKDVSILIYLLTFICTLCLSSGPALADLAGFQNGDFSNGFAGWSGLLFSTGSVDPDSDTHFSIIPQGAQIQNDDFDFKVTIYQDFQMAPLSSGNTGMNLNYWIRWSPSADEQGLNINAFLYEYDPSTHQFGSSIDLLKDVPLSDLLQGVRINSEVTVFAGKSARLAFSVTDYDLVTPDYLRVGNISFSKQGNTNIPAPSALLLMLSGLVWLAVSRRKTFIS